MGYIVNQYKKNFLIRYDKDGAIPYLSLEDFPGLRCEKGSFKNSSDVVVRYFTYSYDGPRSDKLILFLPGLGPGHTAYFAEIEAICKAGYRVLTLDYAGTGSSGGECLPSVNGPTRDVIELLSALSPQGEIIPVGHSLGGYTALNVANLRQDVKRAVILSGFISISDMMMPMVKLRFLANGVKRFERKLDAHYGSLDNRKYLSSTTDKILWIHSSDDPMVSYKYNAGQIAKIHNPAIRLMTVEGKKHNPQYTMEALSTMHAWMGEYERQVREGQLDTLEKRKEYFADKPAARMVTQDPEILKEILQFLAE